MLRLNVSLKHHLKLSILGKHFSRRYFETFLFGDNLHEISKPVFLEKNKKNNMLSAEFSQRVVKVKTAGYINIISTYVQQKWELKWTEHTNGKFPVMFYKGWNFCDFLLDLPAHQAILINVLL